jgi:hypothetical protein
LADAHIAGLKTYDAGSKRLEGKYDDDGIRQEVNHSLHSDLYDARTLLWNMEHTDVYTPIHTHTLTLLITLHLFDHL